MNKYPEYIMKTVRETLQDHWSDKEKDIYIIEGMSKDDVLDAVLTYHGFIHCMYSIKGWIEDIYSVEL